jgi:NAD-dependent SIR2 family protein deacetylase
MPKHGPKKRPTTIAPAQFPFSLTDGKGKASFDQTFDGVARLLQGRKNIVVLVGAGISVSCGIPDFRSKDSGLYQTLNTEELGLSCAEDLFCINFFQDEPGPFYSFAKNLYFPKGEDVQVEPSDSHKLLAMLEKRKMLLRVYTQNIDGLEDVAGVSSKKIVYAHGSLRWATCTRCQRKVSSDKIMPFIKEGSVARCMAERKHRRGSNSSTSISSPSTASPRQPLQRLSKRPRIASDDFCGGVLKPGVTFFGETLNDNVRRSLESDREKIDALIVIGTSLSVAPISKVIEYMPPGIPRILINRTVVQPSTRCADSEEEEKDLRDQYVFDAILLGFCDEVTRRLAKKMFIDDGCRTASPDTKPAGCKAAGRLLTEVLKGNDDEYKAENWKTLSVPPERVLLFAGALASHNDGQEELTYQEIAHCDGCSNQIHGTIQKCVVCFDYDLCQNCFPSLSKTHYDGIHTFSAEPGSL